MFSMRHNGGLEWPTFVMLATCYLLYVAGTVWIVSVSFPLAMLITVVAIALHSSLQHEIIHGHPTSNTYVNDALVYPAVGLFIPYLRFKDTHLAHHLDSNLTDPYDDPESNFMDPECWSRMPMVFRALRQFNNTILGRVTIGPIIAQLCFMISDYRHILRGDMRVLVGWVLHLPALLIVALWLGLVAELPVWAYLLCAYIALSVLKIRTFLEHQSHELARGRTVIIEDNGPLAWMFLFNSLHVVHHMHPKVPWYQLKSLFRSNRTRYLKINDGYYFKSYWPILRQYMLRSKDPVPHPLWKNR